MTIYEALMKTADHIEHNPHLYSFANAHMPTSSYDRACVLGRLGDILGTKTYNADMVAPMVLAMDAQTFFKRMMELMPSFLADMNNHLLVVPALRLFAQSYRTQVIPESIRAIFNPIREEHQAHAVI